MDDFVTFYIAGEVACVHTVHAHVCVCYLLCHAGQETTANTLSFAVVLVHQHPEVLERLLLEVEEVLGDKDTITAEDLDKLKYTEQVRFNSDSLCIAFGSYTKH